ncbi:Thioredoxin, phage-associated [Yersinia phage fHe-Yen9-03]|uniref:Thioredoxin, phage-associated n=1 Tax=Yersinia phage fHe-Yen9-03 TaxID=2052743 RepID=A0A2C9CZQ2_9CAUD|nr:Thioredoxin, phage-associated [Yersinia phage fHe-Yen9-03]
MIDRREVLKLRIAENFDAMMDTLECVLNPLNPIKSMTITGASGIGKSYNVIKRLKEADESGFCNYHYLNSKCTTLGLYQALWNAREIGSVLLLDDVDVFDTEDKLNLLKASLETDEERIITYMSTSRHLADNDIPTQFDFRGKIVFITNKDLVKISESNSALSPHVDALMTRGVFIDLEIHDNESIMVHIENIMNSTNIVAKFGINSEGAKSILNFMLKNSANLRKPSLRMPVQLAGLFLQYPDKWEVHATKMYVKSKKV